LLSVINIKIFDKIVRTKFLYRNRKLTNVKTQNIFSKSKKKFCDATTRHSYEFVFKRHVHYKHVVVKKIEAIAHAL